MNYIICIYVYIYISIYNVLYSIYILFVYILLSYTLHTYIHTCMHTYMHAYIHAYIHTYIHTYLYRLIVSKEADIFCSLQEILVQIIVEPRKGFEVRLARLCQVAQPWNARKGMLPSFLLSHDIRTYMLQKEASIATSR